MRVAVYSMTGYANASASAPTASAAALHEASRSTAAKGPAAPALAVEIRSVNGRFLDIAMRLPDELRGLEPALRAMLTTRFKRGKIELRLSGAGNVEGAVLGEVADRNGVKIVGLPNLPGRVPVHASQVYSTNLTNLIEEFWDKEGRRFALRLEDELIKGSLVTHGGEIWNAQLKGK